MYQLFYNGEKPPEPKPTKRDDDGSWGTTGRDARTFEKFRWLLSRLDKADKNLLLTLAQAMLPRKADSAGRRPGVAVGGEWRELGRSHNYLSIRKVREKSVPTGQFTRTDYQGGLGNVRVLLGPSRQKGQNVVKGLVWAAIDNLIPDSIVGQ